MQENRPEVLKRSKVQIPDVSAQDLREVSTLLELDPETTDPAKHYHWFREAALRIGKAKMKGYEIVKKEDGVKTLAGFTDDAADGIMRVGDVILMACDKAEYRKRKKALLKFGESRLSAPAKQFKRNARRRRVKVIRDEEGDE